MLSQQLSAKLSLIFECDGKNLRLVISSNNGELACRKDTVNNLRRFLASNQPQLFKGRLQLHRHNHELLVMLNGRLVGAVDMDIFVQALG